MSIPDRPNTPEQLAKIFLVVAYQGLFELIFYCYYAFPTDYPDDIRSIFGREYFNRMIVPEARAEFEQLLEESRVEAVVTFNKGVFNLVSEQQVRRYIDRLKAGELVRSQVKSIFSHFCPYSFRRRPHPPPGR